MFVQLASVKTLVILSLFVGLSNSVFGQKGIESFGISEGYERLYFEKSYHLKNLTTGNVKSFSQLSFVGDVSNGKIVFKSSDGSYGLMNLDFDEVISPEWVQIKDFGYGYYALAHYSGMMVNEDRGEGNQPYPLLTWKIYSSIEEEFVSDLELIDPMCIYGEIRARDHFQREVKIHLGKINFGYTNPIMKALTYLNTAPEAGTTIAPVYSGTK